jgi:FkbM family methyltransferase
MIINWIGQIYRIFPNVYGKNFIKRNILTPFIRGKGYECIIKTKTPGGGKLICNLDDWIPWNIFLSGSYCIEKMYELFMMNLAKESEIIFDIGANIGYYTIQFSKLCKKEVYAFEPMTYQFNVLIRNININNIKNVHVMKNIVSEELGIKRIFFYGMDNTGSSSVEIKSEKYEDVKTITIDDFVEKNNIEIIDLVKIDVEGHELHVLKGMKNILSKGKIKNLFVEINNNTLSIAGTNANEICCFLAEVGYKAYSIKSGKKEKYVIGEDESLVYFSRN